MLQGVIKLSTPLTECVNTSTVKLRIDAEPCIQARGLIHLYW